MTNILKQFPSVKFNQTYRSDEPKGIPLLSWGLMRVQWGGPWTKAGVPMRVRYRHTHWVAVCGDYVFDVNAVLNDCFSAIGWLDKTEWTFSLMPWLREGCDPKCDGTFWPTHGIEVVTPPDWQHTAEVRMAVQS